MSKVLGFCNPSYSRGGDRRISGWLEQKFNTLSEKEKAKGLVVLEVLPVLRALVRP
jgi:uncharacterized protein (DUF302 family)